MKVKQAKNMWICVHVDGYPDYSSISCYKKESIKKFISGSFVAWKEAKKYGNSCIKVNITFEII